MFEYTPELMLVVIIFGFLTLLKKAKNIMATVNDINVQFTAVATDVTRIAALVKDLHDQVANGTGPATQADLDAFDASLASIQNDLANIK